MNCDFVLYYITYHGDPKIPSVDEAKRRNGIDSSVLLKYSRGRE